MASLTSTKSSTTAKILKALSVFGGVQAIQILCSVVRTKLVALWIGPAGVGLIAIYNSTIDLLSTSTQLNLRQSAVRDLSLARTEEEASRISAIVRRLALVLGILGMIIVVSMSPLLSFWSFGDWSHTLPYIILSVVMICSAVSSGEWAIMQGREHLKSLAKSTLYASLTATILSLPLFWFFRLKGIVPVLLLFAASNIIYSLIFRVRSDERIKISLKQAWQEGRGILSLGLYMTVSSAFTLLASYIFIAWLNRGESESAVGCYQAGYTLVNTYVGMIFTAIAMEYYPRLTASIHQRKRSEVIVSHEISTALWVLMPLVVLFICAKKLIVGILYTDAFDAVLPYITLAIIGVFFRGASWCMAFTMLARGDGKIYVLTELTSACAYLALNIPLYTCFGFAGLGAAYIIWYAIYTAVCYAVYRYRYGMKLRKGVAPQLLLAIALGACAYGLDFAAGPWFTLLIFLPPTLFAAFKKLWH